MNKQTYCLINYKTLENVGSLVYENNAIQIKVTEEYRKPILTLIDYILRREHFDIRVSSDEHGIYISRAEQSFKNALKDELSTKLYTKYVQDGKLVDFRQQDLESIPTNPFI